MTFKLLHELPAELLIRVGECLNARDCGSLSAANSTFRQILASTVYGGLRATSKPEDSIILQGIVEKQARHVHTLHLELYLNEWSNAGKDDVHTVSNTSPLVWDMLSRRALPNLSTLKISFIPEPESLEGDGWANDGCGGGIYIFNDGEEGINGLADYEAKFPWRALYNKAFESIASGSKGLRRLEVRNLPPRTTSTQQTPEWAAMMNGLEEFYLTPWGGDNGVGWHANTEPGYLASIEYLRDTFFKHLTAAKIVRLAAHPDNPIGCDDGHHVPIPFRPRDLPKLTHLTLQDCFVDHALLASLEQKPGQLKSLRLINCFSAGNHQHHAEARVAVSWAEFFSAIRRTQPKLEEFVLEGDCTAPLTHDEQFHRSYNDDGEVIAGPRYEPPDNEPENVKAVRRGLKEDPSRRLFDYKRLDDKYGMVFAYEEVNIEGFMLGEDQREFEALMRVVEENRRAARIEGS